jgi:dTDP-4-amino-4,6-dideoxygalactose transaminase
MAKYEQPRFPVRRESASAALLEQFREKDWSRLEGVPELEADLRAFHGSGAENLWYLASGTAAIEALLLGYEIGPGDEVITTPYTWGATVSAILAVGAVPQFADINPETGLIDPNTVESQINERTAAIIGVHLFGWPCDNVELARIARKHGLRYFEDGSQAHGARLHGDRVGLAGDGAAFSCMGMKPLAGSEGGYAIFKDRDAYETAALYGKHPRGLDSDAAARLGEAGLLDTLQLGWRPCAFGAALVRAQLPHLAGENSARRMNIAVLRERLGELPGVRIPEEPDGAEPVYHLLSIVFEEEKAGLSRTDFSAAMRERGWGFFVYIPTPVHRMTRLNPHGYEGPRVFWHEQLLRAGVDYSEISCPAAEWRSDHSLEMAFNWTEAAPEAMGHFAESMREVIASTSSRRR